MKYKVPEISNERLEELCKRIKPVVRFAKGTFSSGKKLFRSEDGFLYYIKDVDSRRVAFTWDPKPTEKAPESELQKLRKIRTYHTCGHPVFFKPSIAEVVAQIPEDLVDKVVAFELNDGGDIVNGGRGHRAVVTLYGVKDGSLPADQEPETKLFFDSDVIKSYVTARNYAKRTSSRLASMKDLVDAKIDSEPFDEVWTHYIDTMTGEFYGKSKSGTPILLVAHGIDKVFDLEKLMKREPYMKLTKKEFLSLESGKDIPVEILDYKHVVKESTPYRVLNCEQALNDPLVHARLGPRAEDFVKKHGEITFEESENRYILDNEHRCGSYEYIGSQHEYTGVLIGLSQLRDVQRGGGEQSSVSTELQFGERRHAARFMTIRKK